MKRRNFISTSLLAFFAHLWISCKPSGKNSEPLADSKKTDKPIKQTTRCKVTNSDNRGKFYRADAPVNNSFSIKGKTTFILKGTVYSEDCVTKIPNAKIELWQADEHGAYDMTTDKFENRTIIKTNEDGYYEIVTFMPGYYSTRPKHIHFIVNDEEHQELTTQVYFKNDERALKLANSYKGKYDGRLLEVVGGKERFAEFNIYLKKY